MGLTDHIGYLNSLTRKKKELFTVIMQNDVVRITLQCYCGNNQVFHFIDTKKVCTVINAMLPSNF